MNRAGCLAVCGLLVAFATWSYEFATWANAQPCVTFADLVIVKNASPEIVESYLRKWEGAMARAARQNRSDLHPEILARYRAWFEDVQPLGLRDFAAIQATPVTEGVCG